MKRSFMCLLMVVLVLVFSNSSQAQFPCYPGDLADTCCGADSGLEGYSWDLGICDTLYVVPWPHTDTCFGDTCINDPDEHFPCFLYVNLFVTHDSNTFWWENEDKWVQDSISAFEVPLTFWHQLEGCADSVIFPFNADNPEDENSLNNILINKYAPMGQSMFRHFVDSRTGDTVYYNRMLEMVEDGKAQWTVYTDIESHSSDGDSGHVFFSVVPMSQTCQRWWEGERVLLATLTFQVYMSENCDTTEICFDSTFWPPASQLTFGRLDAKVYFPRHFLPLCFRVPAPEWLRITVSPGSVNFDSVEVGDSSDTTITITNYGNANLEIYSINVSTEPFHLTDTSIHTIPPANSATFKVHFAPSDTGLFEDTIRISSNAFEGDSVVPLSGVGIPATGVRWIEGSTEEESRPTTFSVSRNYPNPFNPVTNFKVTLPEASHVKIEIFNILGQKVKTLVDKDMRAGIFIVDWDGKDDRGLEVSSGVYFYRIIAGDFSDIKKMVLLK